MAKDPDQSLTAKSPEYCLIITPVNPKFAWIKGYKKSSVCLSVLNTFSLPLPPEIPGKKLSIMARVCQVTGKVPVGGHKVSHSNVKTKRRFLPNLQKKRFYLPEEDKWITLKLTTDAIRLINKKGLYTVIKELRAEGQHI